MLSCNTIDCQKPACRQRYIPVSDPCAVYLLAMVRDLQDEIEDRDMEIMSLEDKIEDLEAEVAELTEENDRLEDEADT